MGGTALSHSASPGACAKEGVMRDDAWEKQAVVLACTAPSRLVIYSPL
jgi:hypothetical protein